MTRAVLGLLAALPVLFQGGICSPDVRPHLRRPDRRAPLFSGLRSYDPPAAIQRQLGVKAWAKEKVFTGQSPQGCCSEDFRYHVRLAWVADARHLGSRGRLELTFLNDRLVRAAFFPGDGEDYVERLVAALRLRPAGDRRGGKIAYAGGPPHVAIRVGRRRAGVEVVWEDRRLMKAYWEVQARGASRYMK